MAVRNKVSDQQLVAHIKSRYTYDARQGVVRNRKNETIKGAGNGLGYLQLNAYVDGNTHKIGLHHLVWALVYGRFPKQIDHINGNPLDNRIENLREVTQRENDMNRVFSWKPNDSTGLPGVWKSQDKFQIHVDGKYYSFRDKYDAFFTLTMLGRMFKDS